MSTDVIKANIVLDTVSSTAITIYNLNPGVWSSPGQVPRYLYTSLSDLMSTWGTLSDLVVADYGQATLKATVGIILQPTEIVESVHRDFARSDEDGGEYGYTQVLVKNLNTSTDYLLTRDIGLRLRYILDEGLRGLPNNQFMLALGASASTDMIILNDNSIYPNSYYKVQWENSGILYANQQVHTFRTEYVRVFV